jgi:DNA replication ATP-dependent helicase Dna2
MKNIDKQIGNLLFDRILEVVLNSNLTPKERIPKFRTILDDLFKALTSDVNQHFSDLHNRSVFVFMEYEVPENIQKNVNFIRIIGNKVVHESSFKPSELDERRCLYRISIVLEYFSKLEIPEEISSIYSSDMDKIIYEEPSIKTQRQTYDFYGVIESISFLKNDQNSKLCIISCQTDSLGPIKLKLWNNKNDSGFGSDLTPFGKIAKPYQYFYISDVEKYVDKENEYFAKDRSRLVLEPDYIIDAKELSECRQRSETGFNRYEDNPLLYILSRFTKGEVSYKVMVGNIVGQLLDDEITNPGQSYEDTFSKVMRQNSFGMLSIAHENGKYDRQNVSKVYLKAKDHKKRLQETLQEFHSHECIIEPTFISNKYGLQGRLDLLVDYGKGSNRKDIIELKSSESYPGLQYGMYHNHEAQVLCYNLLLESTFSDRVGNGSILYSSAPSEESPIRSAAPERHLSVQDLLMLRNKIVASEINLAQGDFKVFLEILSDPFGACPPFQKEQLSDFRSTIQGLDGLLKKYFFGYLKFIYRELQVAKIGSNDLFSKSNGYADLWKASKTDKIDNYDVLLNIKIEDVTDDFHIILSFKKELFTQTNVEIISAFRVGDSAVFYPTPNPDELNPLKSQILKCRIVRITHDVVEISLINKQVDKRYFEHSPFWALERDFRENSYKQQLQLMYQFLKSDENVIELVLGNLKPQFDASSELLENELDEVQHDNVIRAVSAKDYYLIQGPPGTGKTSKVLVEIVRNLLNKQGDTMVLAFTNRAVDEICEKMIEKKVECIRLGRGEKPYYWSSLSNSLSLDKLSERVGLCRVFVSTISTFASSLDLLKIKNFETLIIDEASQVLESQIVGILKHFKKWILIGDENQLPAVVVQKPDDSKCDDHELLDISLSNFRESLFYRLKKNAVKKGWNDCHGMLRYQYRMHEDVAAFPKEYFYDNLIETRNKIQNEPFLPTTIAGDALIQEVLTKNRVIFIPTNSDKRPKINEEEAKLVSALVNQIAVNQGPNFNPDKTVGVITPFRAQIAKIRQELSFKYRDITIDTVERFQGSEREIIILSLATRSASQFSAIQSINDEGVDRKLNVALTRAKEQVIILGSEDVLEKSEIFKQLITFVKTRGGYMVNPLKAKSIPKDLF